MQPVHTLSTAPAVSKHSLQNICDTQSKENPESNEDNTPSNQILNNESQLLKSAAPVTSKPSVIIKNNESVKLDLGRFRRITPKEKNRTDELEEAHYRTVICESNKIPQSKFIFTSSSEIFIVF